MHVRQGVPLLDGRRTLEVASFQGDEGDAKKGLLPSWLPS